MSIYEELKKANPHISIIRCEDSQFGRYGRLIHDADVSDMIEQCRKEAEVPEEGVVYIPSVHSLEIHSYCDRLRKLFGGLEIQCGICIGRNSMLNGLEYHKSSEINIAVTDMVLLLADIKDLDLNSGIDSGMVKAFYIESGSVVELFATSLHYCPCSVQQDFCSIVVLPSGTNTSLTADNSERSKIGDSDILFARNKWLVAHKENTALIERGAKSGIYNTNWKITPVA